MNHDALAELLRDADAAAPPAPVPAGLAERVRARRHAQVRRRRVAVGSVLSVVAVAAFAWVPRIPRGPRTGPIAQSTGGAVDTAALRAESSRLQAEAMLRVSVADGLLSRVDRRLLAARAADLLASQAPIDPIQSERDKAALTLIDHGDRLRRDLKEVDAALAAYRRTIELFPDTRWAAVAKQRIEQLNPGARRADHNSSIT